MHNNILHYLDIINYTKFDGFSPIPGQIPLLSVLYEHVRALLCEKHWLDQDL